MVPCRQVSNPNRHGHLLRFNQLPTTNGQRAQGSPRNLVRPFVRTARLWPSELLHRRLLMGIRQDLLESGAGMPRPAVHEIVEEGKARVKWSKGKVCRRVSVFEGLV